MLLKNLFQKSNKNTANSNQELAASSNNENTISISEYSKKMSDLDYAVDFDLTSIQQYLDLACSMLAIEMPKLYFFPYLNGYGGYVFPSNSLDPYAQGTALGHYPGNNIIYISIKDPDTEEILDISIILFTIIHEFRHRWQEKYMYSQYYSDPNANNCVEAALDKSEIDADAYAALFLQYKTSFNQEIYMQQMNYWMSIDEDRRKIRMRQIKNQFIDK